MNTKPILTLVAATALFSLNLQAIDAFPAPYRGAPDSVAAGWDFGPGGMPPTGPVAFELPTPGALELALGWDAIPASGPLYTGPEFAPSHDAPYAFFDGVLLEIWMPNIIDILPEKLWQVQIHYSNPAGLALPPILLPTGALPQLNGLIPAGPGGTHAFDSGATIDYPSPEFDDFGLGGGPAVTLPIVPGLEEVALYEGYIIPNPDYEVFAFDMLPGTEIHQIIVDTISVPEPSAYALLAGVLTLALAVFRRRR